MEESYSVFTFCGMKIKTVGIVHTFCFEYSKDFYCSRLRKQSYKVCIIIRNTEESVTYIQYKLFLIFQQNSKDLRLLKGLLARVSVTQFALK